MSHRPLENNFDRLFGNCQNLEENSLSNEMNEFEGFRTIEGSQI